MMLVRLGYFVSAKGGGVALKLRRNFTYLSHDPGNG
jgi:hypothetical protein